MKHLRIVTSGDGRSYHGWSGSVLHQGAGSLVGGDVKDRIVHITVVIGSALIGSTLRDHLCLSTWLVTPWIHLPHTSIGLLFACHESVPIRLTDTAVA